ncbi:MAG: DUF2784 family protein [Novosphingobium sp.]|nr:DUF2784 family protein [Novosphingobium sp.]
MGAVILAVHVAIIGFNLFGLVAIPLGAWRGWRFVHAPLWRLLHFASLAVVALQAALGRACFLTLWQAEAEGASSSTEPLIMRWVNGIVFWPLPLWVFAAIYIALFAYAVSLLWLVPLRRRTSDLTRRTK